MNPPPIVPPGPLPASTPLHDMGRGPTSGLIRHQALTAAARVHAYHPGTTSEVLTTALRFEAYLNGDDR